MDNQLVELISDASDVLSAVVQSNSMARYPSAVKLMLQKAIALFPKYQTAVKGTFHYVACTFFEYCLFRKQIYN